MPVEAGSIVLIDEFPLRRAALKALLDAWLDPEAFAVFESDMARATVLLEVEPTASLLILNVGGGSLEDATHRHHLRLLRSVAPDAPLAILGERDSPEEIQVAIRLGAQAFLPASLEPDFVENCLSFLISGGSFFPTTALIAVAEEAAEKGPEDDGPAFEKPVAEDRERRGHGRERRGSRGEGGERPHEAQLPLGVRGPSDAQAAHCAANARVADRFSAAPQIRAQDDEATPTPCAAIRSHEAHAAAHSTGARCRNGHSPRGYPRSYTPQSSDHSTRDAPAPGPAEPTSSDPVSKTARGGDQPHGPLDGPFAPTVQEVIRALTPRQREVLELLAQGASNKEIARKLNATEPTVKIHVRQIIKRFGVSNRTQVVVSMFEKDRDSEEPEHQGIDAGRALAVDPESVLKERAAWPETAGATRSALGS